MCACVCVERPESAIVIYSLEERSLLKPGPHVFLARLEAMDSWLVLWLLGFELKSSGLHSRHALRLHCLFDAYVSILKT